MSITQYLDLAYATLAEDHLRRGGGLVEVLDSLKEYAARRLGQIDEVAPASGNTYVRPSDRSVVEMNNNSLATLEAVMGGFNFG